MKLRIVIVDREPGVYKVSLYGPLDAATYAEFEEEIAPVLNKATKAIILNMEGVNYISSMGLGAIFKITNLMHAQNGALLLTNLQPQIKKVFDTVKALPENIFVNLDEADEYLNAIQKKALERDKPGSF